MRFRQLLVLLLLLILWTPAMAAPPDPLTFRTKVQSWSRAQQLTSVIQAVRLYPDLAKQAFEHWWSQSPSDERSDQLNVLARALEMEGHAQPAKKLKEAGLLWAPSKWAGTLFEDDDPLRLRGSIPENMAAAEYSPQANGLAALVLCLRVSNQAAFPDLVTKYRALGKVNEAELEVLHIVAMESGGQWKEAVARGEAALKSGLVKDPELQLQVQLAVLAAARQAGLPQVVDAHLASVNQLPGARSGLTGFILASLSFERECQKDPDLSLERLLERHAAAWALLDGVDNSGRWAGPGRWSTRACSIWVFEAIRRMRSEARDFPVYAQLYYLMRKDLTEFAQLSQKNLNLAVQPSQPAQFLEVWNPEFALGTFAVRLQAVERLREARRGREAAELLEELRAPLEQLREGIRNATLAYQLAQQRVQGGAFEFPWTQGEISRVLGLYHLECLRMALTNLKGAPSAAQQHDLDRFAEESGAAQQAAGGFLGLEEVGWERLNYLFQVRPNGWQASVRQLLGNLDQRNQRYGYRPGAILVQIRNGELAAAEGHKPQAIEALRKAVAQIEEYLAEVGGSQAAGVEVRKRYQRAYELLAKLLLESGSTQEAFELLARLGQLDSINPSVVSKGPAQQAVAQLGKLRAANQVLEGEISARQRAGQDTQAQQGLLAEGRSRFYTTLGDIRRAHPDYERVLAVRPVNFGRLQGSLPDNTTVVQFFPSDEELFAFVLTRQELKIRRSKVSRARLEALQRQVNHGIVAQESLLPTRGVSRALATTEKPKLREALTELYGHLIAPIEQDLGNRPVLAVVPSGSLAYLPFQALLGPGDKYLIESRQVVTVLKSSDLEMLAKPVAAGKGKLVGIGNPDGTLPAAQVEAQRVGALFPGASILLGPQATRERLEPLTKGATWLHLATHGLLNNHDPNASYLVLANGQKLSVPDVAQLDLGGVRLVTLSACQTALGENSSASAELTTLADAFGFAGSPTVVASLWQVSDASTEKLMVKFYSLLAQGQPLAQAFQTAQIELLRSPDSAHPFFWSPFLLIGDWR